MDAPASEPHKVRLVHGQETIEGILVGSYHAGGRSAHHVETGRVGSPGGVETFISPQWVITYLEEESDGPTDG